MHRVDGLNVNVAIFTNLTPEHLDFHGTMDNYLKAKQKIFTRLNQNQFCVLNNGGGCAGRKGWALGA